MRYGIVLCGNTNSHNERGLIMRDNQDTPVCKKCKEWFTIDWDMDETDHCNECYIGILEKKLHILKKFVDSQESVPPKFAKVISKKFWSILA